MVLYFNKNENIQQNNGIFAFARANYINVSISSPSWYENTKNSYCYHEGVSQKVSCVIDGTNSTAWRNKEENEAFFLIDFQFSTFYLTSYSLISAYCWSIPPWTISGSNDLHNWYLIDTETNEINAPFFKHFQVDKLGSYRYFNFSAIPGKIHLTQIEFFGILNNRIPTCQKEFQYKSLHILCIILFYFK